MATFDDDYLINYFSEAINYVKNTKALILDIRHNNGGSYQNIEAVVSRFITSPLEKPEFYVLGELINLPPFEPQGSFQYVNPVVVLINGVCYSSGDFFPDIMKQISTVTVVGDTTAGGSSGSTSSAPAEYKLPSGKTIFVGTTDLRRYDGLPWEWVGVPPDIRVEQTEQDIINGIDKQLEFAINILK
jgi:C-terminal processing protease CtpA/Prc